MKNVKIIPSASEDKITGSFLSKLGDNQVVSANQSNMIIMNNGSQTKLNAIDNYKNKKSKLGKRIKNIQ
jgi:hypothetical protein